VFAGDLFEAVIDAFEALDDHPEDPQYEDIKNAKDCEQRKKVS
jgi:hypothetical protein